jgi:hypothetical protein
MYRREKGVGGQLSLGRVNEGLILEITHVRMSSETDTEFSEYQRRTSETILLQHKELVKNNPFTADIYLFIYFRYPFEDLYNALPLSTFHNTITLSLKARSQAVLEV